MRIVEGMEKRVPTDQCEAAQLSYHPDNSQGLGPRKSTCVSGSRVLCSNVTPRDRRQVPWSRRGLLRIQTTSTSLLETASRAGAVMLVSDGDTGGLTRIAPLDVAGARVTKRC